MSKSVWICMCAWGDKAKLKSHSDLGMLELSLLLRNEVGNISSITSINISALWFCHPWWPRASPDILPKGKLINGSGMELWPYAAGAGWVAWTQGNGNNPEPGTGATRAGVWEETSRAPCTSHWAGYWCLPVPGTACGWFLFHCVEMSKGWEPSPWAMAAAGCQREAHSAKMGELGSAEPLHFCSWLIFFRSESL